MANGFKLDDYVDVAQRIQEFYDKYPEGRLVTGTLPHVVDINGRCFVWYHARAYRTPDDPLPGDGWAAEPVPGPTTFTKDSELMNAETAAWGRAIVALGFATKKIASAQEVRNRQDAKSAPEPQSLDATWQDEFDGMGTVKETQASKESPYKQPESAKKKAPLAPHQKRVYAKFKGAEEKGQVDKAGFYEFLKERGYTLSKLNENQARDVEAWLADQLVPF